ncbi:MAG TPA: hypothetical protein VEF05_00615 [Terriglobales bacterium]|nr:hypothetical protein [Terriglobales bacterium]
MEDLREKLESELAEHQRESGLHVIGGRDRLIQRLLSVLGPLVEGRRPSEPDPADQHGACCR